MTQTAIMLEGEADAWFERNQGKLGKSDPISDMIGDLKLKLTHVLEVGCSNGWRLRRLQDAHRCKIAGVDPSTAATGDAHHRAIVKGTADCLPWPDTTFDMVIFGFCLYLCDPQDLFKIASEANRVLRNRGHIAIYDFADGSTPYSRVYEHNPRLLAYHMDHAKLWLAHPWYRLLQRRQVPDGAVTIIQKRADSAFPVHDSVFK